MTNRIIKGYRYTKPYLGLLTVFKFVKSGTPTRTT